MALFCCFSRLWQLLGGEFSKVNEPAFTLLHRVVRTDMNPFLNLLYTSFESDNWKVRYPNDEVSRPPSHPSSACIHLSPCLPFPSSILLYWKVRYPCRFHSSTLF